MPKRKRDEAQPGEAAGNGSGPKHSVQLVRAERMVQHGAETLAGSFKLAKGFERQKLSRRLKTAKSKKDDKDVARINAEIEALRTLDLASTATNYIVKTLLKIKAVANSPHLPPSLSNPAKAPSDPAVLNIVARMCKSTPVRNALPAILKEVENVLGVEETKAASNEAKAGPVKKASATKSEDNAAASSESAQDADSFEGFSDDAAEQAGVDIDSDMDDDALGAYDDRLASSSDEDEDDERPKFDARALLNLQGSGSEAESDEDDLELSDAPEPTKGTVRRRASPSPSRSPSPPPAKRPTTSAFLPSLTSGYISGGSDSDPEAEFDDLVGENGGKPKKNRRGQRARQAIWEKKYGKEAKHVTNDKGKRDDGWDAKRGATDGRGGWGRGGRGGARGGFGGGGRGGRQSGPAPERVKHKDDDGKLHPSWEAAKKRKDAAQQNPVKFAGKKISFD